MSIDKFSFVPEEHGGGQLLDSSPGQKFMKPFDPVYECIQNSIDASIDQNKSAKLAIHFQKVYTEDFYFFNDVFKEHIKESKKIADRFVLAQDRVELLIMEDFNTTGITGEPDNFDDQTKDGKQNNYFYMNLSCGATQKLEDPRLGGSEGEGTQAYNLNSEISTFFYYSIDSSSNNRGAFYGITYLGSRKLNTINYLPFAFFGKKEKNTNSVRESYFSSPVTDEEELLKLTKLFKLKRKKNESGTSIIIPFYKKKGIENKELLIAKIIDVYRAAILRGQLEVQIEEKTINQDSLLNMTIDGINPKNEKPFNTQHKDLVQEYYNFLKESNEKKSIDIELTHSGKTRIEKKEFGNFDELLKKYNNKENIKVRINFQVTKKNKEATSSSNRYVDKHTYVDFFIKKYPSWAELEESLNDFLRGKMSLHKLRGKMQCFYLMDFQEEEAKLLLKNAEVANHSDITASNPKLDNNYKNYRNTISFFKIFPSDLYNLFNSSENVSDFDITQDLFKTNEGGGGVRNTDVISEDEDEDDNENTTDDNNEDKLPESIFKVPDIVVLPIFPSLQYYERTAFFQKEKVIFHIVGTKYSKEEIKKKLEIAENYIIETELVVRKNFNGNELLRMDTKVKTFKKRILEYKDFLTRGCTFYPRRIEIEAAFDGEGMGRKSFKRYCLEDFDFGNEKQFKMEFINNVKKDFAEENKITLVAKNDNFEFKLTGFGEKNIEDIRWADRSYSIEN